jgi:hypothetical protein
MESDKHPAGTVCAESENLSLLLILLLLLLLFLLLLFLLLLLLLLSCMQAGPRSHRTGGACVNGCRI